jgi:adenylate kinase
MMWVILLGPPGAGKGTQAQALSSRHGWLHLAMGDLLREAVTQETSLGKEAAVYMKQGTLVPDRIIISLIQDRLSSSAVNPGCLFDGFPRNLSQARELDRVMHQQGRDLDRAISLEANEEALVRRLTSRRVCGRCHRVYNLLTNPSKAGDCCESCGENLQQRTDDQEETIRRRLAVYREDTEPLKDYYKHQGILSVISGDASPEEVGKRIEDALGRPSPGR